MWGRVKFTYQQLIQRLNTKEKDKGLEISKIWSWIVQNAILMSFEQLCQTEFFYTFLVLKKHTYALYYSTFWAKFVVDSHTCMHWAKQFGKCALTLNKHYRFTALQEWREWAEQGGNEGMCPPPTHTHTLFLKVKKCPFFWARKKVPFFH
jgi:hypothetical protein